MTDFASTTSTVAFYGVAIQDRWPWPGHTPWPLTDRAGQPMDQSQPLTLLTNPKFYYKYLRLRDLHSISEGWSRTFYMPPGTTTPLLLDRLNGGYLGVCAWTLFFARPENTNLVIRLHSVTDESQLTLLSDSPLQRISNDRGIMCSWNEFDNQGIDTRAEWSMSQGSCLADTGANYFTVTNTGTTTQYLVTLASFNPRDISQIMESPVVRPLNLVVNLPGTE